MQAQDIMTREVVSVHAAMPIREIAKLLLQRRISAVPVIDDAGIPIGMVSEGDLIGRNDADREARRDWWLTLFAEGEALHPDFLATLKIPDRTAHEIMSAPIISVGENTEIDEVARLLASYHIKRVPVVHEGKIVGIVSRADLVGAMAASAPREIGLTGSSSGSGVLNWVDRHYRHEQQVAAALGSAPEALDHSILSARDFQSLVDCCDRQRDEQRAKERRAASDQRRRNVAELIDTHVPDEKWRIMLHSARQAAEQGDKEFLLLRFPCQLCSDGGRAINVVDTGWPETLRGEAAEIYLRWERDLKLKGFHLVARVLDFPGGVPGDIGLFLVWGVGL